MRIHFVAVLVLTIFLTGLTSRAAEIPSITIGTFMQEVRQEFAVADGLPADSITAVAALDENIVFAGTSNGLARFSGGRWAVIPATSGAPVDALVASRDKVCFVSNGRLFSLEGDKPSLLAELTRGLKVNSLIAGESIYLATDQGLFEVSGGKLKSVGALNELLGSNASVFQVAAGSRVVVGAAAGLFQQDAKEKWTRLFPADKSGRSWAPVNVRGVAYDTRGRLWFASPQGVGRFD